MTFGYMTRGEIQRYLENEHPGQHGAASDRKIRKWRINASYPLAANIYARKNVRVRAIATMMMIGSSLELIRAGSEKSYLWATGAFIVVLTSFFIRLTSKAIIRQKVDQADKRHGVNYGRSSW